MPTPALSTKAKPNKPAKPPAIPWKDKTNAQKNAARAANKPSSSGSSGGPSGNYIDQLTPTIAPQVNYLYDQAHKINDKAGKIGQQAQNYAQNNPFSKQAQSFNADLLSGSMANNKWEQSAFNDSEAIQNPYNSALDALQGFVGGSNGQGGGSSSPGRTGVVTIVVRQVGVVVEVVQVEGSEIRLVIPQIG